MSYLDRIDVGIVADRDQMPDVQKLIGWLADGVSELLPEGVGVANPGDAASAGSESSADSEATPESTATER
jgi:hypothetical protein